MLSIDVALGAVCSSAWLANHFHVQLRVQAYCALGLTVWIIYTADHLLDAHRIKHQASSYRHRYHQQNFKLLTFAILLAILIDFVFVFYIRQAVFYSGLFLSCIITGYLLMSRWIGYLKEFFVAVLYCGGVLLPIVSIGGFQLISQHALLVTIFFITALINTILFSWFDRESDCVDKQQSLVSVVGEVGTKKIIWFLFMIQLVLVLYGSSVMSTMVLTMAILMVMNGVLLIIFLNWKWFSLNDKYRLAGDAIFLFPIFILLNS